MFVAINVVGIVAGTIAAMAAVYLLGYELDADLIITCFGFSAAICLFGSFALWPDIWQKKS
jgi:hypothetical protein